MRPPTCVLHFHTEFEKVIVVGVAPHNDAQLILINDAPLIDCRTLPAEVGDELIATLLTEFAPESPALTSADSLALLDSTAEFLDVSTGPLLKLINDVNAVTTI